MLDAWRGLYAELGPVLFAVKLAAGAAFIMAWLQVGAADWLHQRVKNSLLWFWTRVLAVLHFIVLLNTVFGIAGKTATYLVPAYWAELGLYLVFSIGAGLLLWQLRVWPAGDAKLFGVLALLFPLLELPRPFHGGLRFLEVLINIFIPAMLVLFALSLRFLHHTRLRHITAFLRGLGPRAEKDFLVESSRALLGTLVATARGWLELLRDPRPLLASGLQWGLNMLLMAFVGYYMRDIVTSNVGKTLVFFAIFMLWSRVVEALGRGVAYGIAAGLAAILLHREPDFDWRILALDFGHITVFSLCIYGGIRWTATVLAGEAAALFLPLGMLLVSFLPWGLFGRFAWPGGVGGSLLTWAGMGVFFGLAFIFVKVWDEETYQSVRVDQARPWMNVGPSLLAKMREDEEFFEEHFDSLYADGLTPDQLEALKEWCEENGIEQIPLAPTMSFASWIFVGYALTSLLDGPVMHFVF